MAAGLSTPSTSWGSPGRGSMTMPMRFNLKSGMTPPPSLTRNNRFDDALGLIGIANFNQLHARLLRWIIIAPREYGVANEEHLFVSTPKNLAKFPDAIGFIYTGLSDVN